MLRIASRLSAAALAAALAGCTSVPAVPPEPPPSRARVDVPDEVAKAPSAGRPRPAGVPALNPIGVLGYDDQLGTRVSLEVFELQAGPQQTEQMWFHAIMVADAGPGHWTTALAADPATSSTADGFVLVDGESRALIFPMVAADGSSTCTPLADLATADNEAWGTCLFSRPKAKTVTVQALHFGSIPHAQVR